METVACRIGVDLGIFELLKNANSPQTLTDIAKQTPGADPTLVGQYVFCEVNIPVVNNKQVEFCDASSHSEPLVGTAQLAIHRALFQTHLPIYDTRPASNLGNMDPRPYILTYEY